jgi:alpha-glucosidase
LPQPATWASLTVETQLADPGSMLSLYRALLAIRHAELDLRGPDLRWLRTPADVLAFQRGDRFVCLTNLSSGPVSLPAGASLVLASAPLADGWLPVDATAWLRVPGSPDTTGGGRG